MLDTECIARARWLIQQSGQPFAEQLSLLNFRSFSGMAADAVRAMAPSTRSRLPWLLPWAERFAALNGDFEKRIEGDPLLLYHPRTEKHAKFHASNAFVRYLLAANTIGKSLMAMVENKWCATGERHYGGQRGNVVVVSTGHAGYSEKVFVTKYITGEDGDPFSPYIPENGYWFHSFDQRKYLIRIACVECAEAGHPKDCTHTKSIHCLSADSGMERLMGFTSRLVHIDEHIPGEVYRELRQRVRRGNANGRMMVTATPLAGPDAWEIRELYELWKKRPQDNWLDTKDHSRGRFVEVFQISKYDCIGSPGGPTLGEIEGEKATLPPSEFRARVMGEPIPLGDSLFDLAILDKIEEEECREPVYGKLHLGLYSGQTDETLEYAEDLSLEEDQNLGESAYEGFSFWEQPQEGAQYAIGVDTASGINSKHTDASSAYVVKLVPTPRGDIDLEMVAAYYGHTDVYEYAVQIKRLAIWYNQALVIPEVVGIGIAFMTVLDRQLYYPNVFQAEATADKVGFSSDSYFGVRTSAQTKPLMITALHSYISNRKMKIRDKEAVSECRTFQQTRTESGMSYRYGAAGGAHDDRVLAMAFVAYACKHFPDMVMEHSNSPLTSQQPEEIDNAKHAPYHTRKPKPWLI